MKLLYKLLLSHLVVIVVSLIVLALVLATIAPRDFSRQMMMGRQGRGGSSMMNQSMQASDAQLDAAFRSSVNNALLVSGAVAILTAIGLSWLVSRRIVKPIRSVVQVSQHIADGHYDERLVAQSKDEISELILSINQMAAALAETEMMRRQLLADVTHELKTPLSTIKGYMEGLQDNILPATPETFQTIQREAARLQRLVQDLQELSRVESGQPVVECHPVDVVAVIQSVVNRMQPQFQEKSVDLQTRLPDAPLLALADSDRLEQVLTNLMGNALQYTSPDGMVTVVLSQRDKQVHIALQDTGVGLAPDDLKRIFQRFYRVDKSRSRASGGSGIGLTIAKHLIEAQQGRIWAESPSLGRGSIFHITLPAA